MGEDESTVLDFALPMYKGVLSFKHSKGECRVWTEPQLAFDLKTLKKKAVLSRVKSTPGKPALFNLRNADSLSLSFSDFDVELELDPS
jgi:hypothetical protein